MRNTKSVAFPHVSLTRTPTHASRVAHIAVKKTKAAQLCFSLALCSGMERKKEGERKRKREGESSCWWGWTEPLQRHTDGSLWKERITCARLLSCHILIPGPIWEPTLQPSTRHRAPPHHHHHTQQSPQSFSPAAVSTSTSVLL